VDELVPPADRLMVETFVRGRELTVGVLEGRETGADAALPVVEIRTRTGGLFDYHQKYAADGAEELCPAPVDPEVSGRAQALALKVHAVLGLRGLSRTDVMLDEHGGLHVLEVNTLPGMTARGLVPLAAAATGVDFPTLVSNLVRTARLPAG
jgi:D-alanine-D-alanine ligase